MTTTTTAPLVPGDARKSSVPAITLSTLKDAETLSMNNFVEDA